MTCRLMWGVLSLDLRRSLRRDRVQDSPWSSGVLTAQRFVRDRSCIPNFNMAWSERAAHEQHVKRGADVTFPARLETVDGF